MIDCENEVTSRIASTLRVDFPGIDIAGEYVRSPSSFPHVSIIMSDNSLLHSTRDSGNGEHAIVTFDVDVYSNRRESKKTECKQIAKSIDEIMFSMNFERLAFTPVPNLENATIYRIAARYRGVTDGKFFYGR